MQFSSYEQSVLQAAFPFSKAQEKTTREKTTNQNKSEKPKEKTYKSTADCINDIMTGEQWHDAMLTLTARWERLGFKDEHIAKLAPLFTRKGYFVEQTIRQMKE